MAVPTFKGHIGGEPPYVAHENPPVKGDLIVMGWPIDADPPPGWTLTSNKAYCWRYADGDEYGFPFPAAWFSGYKVV